MKIPLNWLKEYVEIPSNIDELTAKLTAIGHMQDKKPEKVGNDVVIDLEVRQNRPDCLSVVGIAREVAAVTNKVFKVPNSKFQIPSTSGFMLNSFQHLSSHKILKQVPRDNRDRQDDTLTIQNTAPELCRRFKAVQIKLGTRNAEHGTPQWMKERLQAYGMKSISPIVDITNYVTIEYGEPLHAFDVRHIEDNTLIIRRAKEGEKLTILGGKVLTLTNDDLLIASKSKPLSLAGMIGGEESGVQADTNEIVLEAATYNQASIRRSSIRHSVRTEASTRHEKFLHPHLAEVALERAASLIVELCRGEVVALAESYPDPVKERTVDLRLSEIKRLGGVTIPLEQTKQYLGLLGISALSSELSTIRCSAPYWRTDIEQEADLVEEVLRLYGYENIPASLPPFPSPKNITSYWFKLEEKIRDVMLQLGFDEQITEPLTKANSKFQIPNSKSKQIILQNALNADKNALRTNLAEGLTYACDYQKKFGRKDVKVFELGKIYGKTTDPANPYFESRRLGFVLYEEQSEGEDLYFNAKGIVETLCQTLGFPYSDSIASIQIVDSHRVYCEVFIEENWGISASRKRPERMLYTDIPNQQRFDISFEVHANVAVGDVIQGLRMVYPGIDEITLGEKPKPLDADKKSVLLRFTSSKSKGGKETLIHNVEKHLAEKYDAVIR